MRASIAASTTGVGSNPLLAMMVSASSARERATNSWAAASHSFSSFACSSLSFISVCLLLIGLNQKVKQAGR